VVVEKNVLISKRFLTTTIKRLKTILRRGNEAELYKPKEEK